MSFLLELVSLKCYSLFLQERAEAAVWSW